MLNFFQQNIKQSIFTVFMGKKVIVAEDNLADVELTKMAFRELDYPLEVVHVIDGQELLNYVKSDSLQDIVLILLDLNMPRLGGVDVLKTFYSDAEFKKLPVIVFSSSAHETDVKACYDFGANAYVCKPIGIHDFNKTIRTIAEFWVDVNVLPEFN
ncbi:MAG: response regulator [Bacteroidota bacterium]